MQSCRPSDLTPLARVLPLSFIPRRRSSLPSLNSAASPHTPRNFDLPSLHYPVSRRDTDSGNSSNADELDFKWKPEEVLFLSRILDALPAHLTSRYSLIRPSILRDEIAHGISKANGLNWPHSIRATRLELFKLARARAKEKALAKQRGLIIEEEVKINDGSNYSYFHDGEEKPVGGPRRPLCRQSSMDFTKPTLADMKDNASITRPSNPLQRTDRVFPDPSYHPYSRTPQAKCRSSSPHQPATSLSSTATLAPVAAAAAAVENGKARAALGVLCCANCGATRLPLWWRGEAGRNVCNVCGTYFEYHGLNPPNSMKETLTKRRKRVPASPGADVSHDYSEETKNCRTTSTNTMFRGRETTIQGGKFTNVGGDYHEHTYVIEDSGKGSKYLKAIQDTVARLEDLFFSKKEDKTKNDNSEQVGINQTPTIRELAQDESIDPPPFRFKAYRLAHTPDPKNFEILYSTSGIERPCGVGMDIEPGPPTSYNSTKTRSYNDKQTVDSRRSKVEIEDDLDNDQFNTIPCAPCNQPMELKFRSLNDPPCTSDSESGTMRDEEHYIYQTPTPSNRQLVAFVPGIVHYLPCWSWLPSWGGWGSWVTSWVATSVTPPYWMPSSISI